MTLFLAGYRIQRRLRSASSARVWAAVREHDQLPVVAKAFEIESDQELEARVEHEFELIRDLDVPGVVKALALERSGRELILILEAHRGVDLREFADGRALAVDTFLIIAIQIAEILAEVHQRRVVHRDLKPANILIDPTTGQVALADFGISVLLESERGRIHEPALLVGTLAYVAPEQTGRTSREVDFRSDLYALGVTFYELLTGRRPFEAESPLELIHAHFARRPKPPQHLRPELPAMLSLLVIKLLEKAPERRYQSARGLAADLQRLQTALAEHDGDGDIVFELGEHDVATTLQLPHQLYGRAREQARLRAAFQRAAADSPELVLIVGPPGIGKSALLDELAEPVIARRGFLARGKFEDESAEPFSAIATAVGSIVDQLLTEAPLTLDRWRTRLEQALAGFAPVIVELVPRLRALLGESEAGPRPAPAEARAQVMLAFGRLLATLARPEHPLVLAIDNLQWADGASIELIDKLLADQGAALLVVATARTVESGGDAARVAELCAKLRARKREPTLLELGPLDAESLTMLIADALAQPRESVAPLARVVGRKTGNNPFFARQFLLLLADMGLLERGGDGWRWDLAALERASLPEDALEMMTAKLARLDDELRELICLASVFGSHFDPLLVERAAGRAVLGDCQRLVEEGLLSPVVGHGYTFAHDRIREAAYALLGARRRRTLHRRVGELLLERPLVAGDEARVFEIADHLDRGHGLVHETESDAGLADDGPLTDAQREALAGINLRAGRRALTSGAPAVAFGYLTIARKLLAELGPFPTRTQARRELFVETWLALGQAATLVAAFELADEVLSELLAQALGAHELSRVAVARCWQLIVSEQRERAVAYGVEVLRSLGVRVPARVRNRHVIAALPRLARRLRPSAIERWSKLEPATDVRARAAMDVLVALVNIAYVTEPLTFVVLVERHAALIDTYGDHPSAPLVFAQAGLILANALGRRREAVELADRCLSICDARGPNPLRYRISNIRGFIRLWTDNFLELAELDAEIIDASLEAGDIENADYAWAARIELSTYGGMHLRALEKLVEARSRWAAQWGTINLAGGGAVFRRACTLLIEGPTPEPGDTDPLHLDELDAGSLRVLNRWAQELLTTMVLAVFGRWREALSLLERAGPALERAIPGTWYGFLNRVLTGLACAELAADTKLSAAARREHRRRLRHCQRALAKWVAKGGRFAHGEVLLRAELAGLDGDLTRAGRLFDEARRYAVAERNPYFEGLICERAANLALRLGLERFAFAPLRDARDAYLRWGAFAKAAALEHAWPERLATGHAITPTDEHGVAASSSSTTSTALDSATLLGASQAIAEDIRLEEVIARVMRLAVENAGAQRGVLLLCNDEELSMAAECEQDRAELLEHPRPLAECGHLVPASLLRWVARTGEAVILDHAGADVRFAGDPYLVDVERAVLCTPIIKHGQLIGLIYLENQLGVGAFTTQRLETLRLLAAQAGSALENARLYDDLRISEIRWRSLVEQLPDYVALAERGGTLTPVSESRHAFDLERHKGELAPALAQVFATGEQQDLEISLDHEVEPRAFVVRMTPIIVDDAIERAIIVATDISERQRAEIERAELEAQLRQQQRLESIGTLASGVAHEINNPVQGIMNYAELIAAMPAADDDIREFAREIEHETQRVASIVRNLLAFSRQERDEPRRRTSVREIVDGTLSLIRAVLRKDQIQLVVEIDDDLPDVDCRPQQIQQVVMNLVTNARDALNSYYRGYHENKRIEIRAHTIRGGQWVELVVMDFGGGVPENVVDRIFDPFFTTKGRDQGTGLGLAVSHGIVADHGGELRLDNRPGQGARFCVELPRA